MGGRMRGMPLEREGGEREKEKKRKNCLSLRRLRRKEVPKTKTRGPRFLLFELPEFLRAVYGVLSSF